MAHYLCRPVSELPSYMQAQLRVQDNTEIYAGEVFNAETLDTAIKDYGNWDVYIPEILTDVSSQRPVIVINNGFETLVDGRRPKGQPDYTQYIYQPNETVTAIRLLPETRFELGRDCIQNGDDVTLGGYLTPVENSNQLLFVSDFSGVNAKYYLVVEALKYFRLGGQFGDQFAKTMVVRAKNHSISAPVPVDPEITAIDADLVPDLQVGNANVASGATVLTMNAQGGTAPFTYTLEDNATLGADNNSFVIVDNKVNVGADALADAKTYQIYVKATDSKGKTYEEGFDIVVATA